MYMPLLLSGKDMHSEPLGIVLKIDIVNHGIRHL